MLREIKSTKLQSLVVPFTVTTTSTPSISASTGSDDIASLSRSGAGQFTVTLKRPFRRNMILIGSPSNVSQGAFAVQNSGSAAPSGSVAAVATIDNTGSSADGTSNWVAFGYNSPVEDIVSSQRWRCAQNNARIIWGKISSAGAVSIGTSDFRVTKSATGVYAVTYKRAFGRTPVVLITPFATSGSRGVKLTNESASGCTVTISTNTPTDTDSDFYIAAVGTNGIGQVGGQKNTLYNSQRKPRIVAGKFLLTGTTPSISVNSPDFGTPTRTGAGDYTINLASAFKREFAFFATPFKTNRVVAHTGGSSSIRFRETANNGTDTDMTSGGTIDFVCIGADDASEY